MSFGYSLGPLVPLTSPRLMCKLPYQARRVSASLCQPLLLIELTHIPISNGLIPNMPPSKQSALFRLRRRQFPLFTSMNCSNSSSSRAVWLGSNNSNNNNNHPYLSIRTFHQPIAMIRKCNSSMPSLLSLVTLTRRTRTPSIIMTQIQEFLTATVNRAVRLL